MTHQTFRERTLRPVCSLLCLGFGTLISVVGLRLIDNATCPAERGGSSEIALSSFNLSLWMKAFDVVDAVMTDGTWPGTTLIVRGGSDRN